MKQEFFKNKLANGIKSEKVTEIPKLDQTYINIKYQQIQESNDRLKKLISKFTNDPERRLNSVHESVICKQIPVQPKREKSSQNKRENHNNKVGGLKHTLDVIAEASNIRKAKNESKNDKKKTDVELASKDPVKIKSLKSKNFVFLNKRDAFDPHCLAGRNAQNAKQTEV